MDFGLKRRFERAGGRYFLKGFFCTAAFGGELIQMLCELVVHNGDDITKIDANPFSRASKTADEWNDWFLGPERK